MGYSYIRNLIILFLCALFSHTSTGCYVPSAVPGNVVDSNLSVSHSLRWIDQDKMRAGYVLTNNKAADFAKVKECGFNTIILKEERFRNERGYTIDEVYKSKSGLIDWGKLSKKENIHLFLAFNWRQYGGYPYRRAVFNDGVEDLAPCPRCQFLWEIQLPAIVKTALQTAKKNNFDINGICLDVELYSPKDKKYRSYNGNKVCYCDNCFSSYFLSRGYQGSQIPKVAKRERYKWLSENKQLEAYQSFLETEIEKYAQGFAQTVLETKNDLLIGMYPSPFIGRDYSNRVLLSIARGLGSKEHPMLVFETTTFGYYSRKGYTRIPENPEQQYAQARIHGKFLAGYLLRRFSPQEIEDNIYYAAKNASGYWLFRIPILWGEFGKTESLYSGEPKDYLEAIKRANKKIDMLE